MHGHWLKDYIGPKASAQGGGGTEPLIVNISTSGELSAALDRTWQEIHDAFPNVILRETKSGIGGEFENLYSVTVVREQNGLDGMTYVVEALQSSASSLTLYEANDPNGYPHS